MRFYFLFLTLFRSIALQLSAKLVMMMLILNLVGKVTRNVFLCYICGAAGCGKTALLRAFAGKPFRAEYSPTGRVESVVGSVDIEGEEKYLVVGFIHPFFTSLLPSFPSLPSFVLF